MTNAERLALIEANSYIYPTSIADLRWLIAEARRLQGENVKSRSRLKEQTSATQEAHEFVDNEIRNHLEGFVELGDKSCPIWQRVRSAVARLTDEVERLQCEYARGRAEERAAVVTYLRDEATRPTIGLADAKVKMLAAFSHYIKRKIERGKHVLLKKDL